MAILKAKYQNDPNKVKECHMFQVIEIFQAKGISKYFLTPTKKHIVYPIVVQTVSQFLFAALYHQTDGHILPLHMIFHYSVILIEIQNITKRVVQYTVGVLET